MTKALREMQGKYIGNRPVKVRRSTTLTPTPSPSPTQTPTPSPSPTHPLPLTSSRPLIKVRKSTWKERAEDGKDMSWMGSSLAVNHKDKGLGSHVKKRAPKKKKGMPW